MDTSARRPSVAPDVPGETLPDPKDKVQVLERYRRAVELAGERKFGDAVTLLQGILAENPRWLTCGSSLATCSCDSDAWRNQFELIVDSSS